MSLVSEFKTFAIKGNAMDLAVGVIIGGAFGKIVSSLVNDIIMPPIGLIIGGVNFKDLKFTLNNPIPDPTGLLNSQPVTINYGNFIQTIFDFTIIAFVIFMMIKGINNIKQKEEAKAAAPPATPPTPSNEEKLLTEIRDLLKK